MKLTFSALVCVASAAVPTVKLNNGIEMPMISIGTYEYNASTAEQVVSAALEAGFNHIDTAMDYGNQKGVSAALKGRDRSSYFITTKTASWRGSAKDTNKTLYDDLAQLGLEYGDLALIHYPPVIPAYPGRCQQMQNQWKVMEEFYNAGKAKAIGVSNYCPSSLECLAKTMTVTPQVVQDEYHVGMGADPIGLKSYCEAHNIHLQAYSPLGDGGTELITGDLVTSIGKSHNKTGAQISLRWVHENGVSLATKTTKRSHMEQDLAIFSFQLTADEKQKLDAATSPAGTPSYICNTETHATIV